MNQHRWTCLTTVVLTTVMAPIATVHAKTLPSPAVGSGDYHSSFSPQSLPTITPLVVTEIETEAAIPAVIHSVPQVSKLPIVKQLASKHKKVNLLNKRHQTVGTGSPATGNRHQQSSIAKLPSTPPIFNPNFQVTEPILSIPNPIDSSISQVNSVVTLPSIATQVAKPQPFRSFATTTVSAPVLIVRSDSSPATVITNSATAQVEMARIPQAQNSQSDKADTTRSTTVISTAIVGSGAPLDRRSAITSVPQVAPLVTHTDDRSDIPSFEAGLPVFVFDNERPQQIVATAIAQVGDTIVAPEPSIAIPVERPKQPTIPTQLPQPLGTGIVKIEQPAATVRPALDKIVATQTGQASWYGIEGGSQTANGERYNPNGLTAAHRTLPFGTKVRVTNLKTGKSTIVRINDRGPFHSRRIIDISAGAAEVIGIKDDGIGNVRMDILGSQG
jgi:rare lipoprotein A